MTRSTFLKRGVSALLVSIILPAALHSCSGTRNTLSPFVSCHLSNYVCNPTQYCSADITVDSNFDSPAHCTAMVIFQNSDQDQYSTGVGDLGNMTSGEHVTIYGAPLFSTEATAAEAVVTCSYSDNGSSTVSTCS